MSEYQPEEQDLVTINMQALDSGDLIRLEDILEFNAGATGDEVNTEALDRLMEFVE